VLNEEEDEENEMYQIVVNHLESMRNVFHA